MSTAAVEHPKSLEARITQRLHESIGDLVTEADLKAMVARGVEDALFRPRTIPRQYGGSDTKPALVEELVSKFLDQQMQAAVTTWIAENPERLQGAVDKVVAASAGEAFLHYLDLRFESIARMTVSEMKTQGLLPR